MKPERELLLAYDDPLGVTAAFNRNLLVRINRELGADFDVDAFAPPRAVERRRSRASRCTWSPRAGSGSAFPARRSTSTFEEGETIWTESSYKYRPDDVVRMLERAGFRAASSSGSTTADGFALTLVRGGVGRVISNLPSLRFAQQQVEAADREIGGAASPAGGAHRPTARSRCSSRPRWFLPSNTLSLSFSAVCSPSGVRTLSGAPASNCTL